MTSGNNGLLKVEATPAVLAMFPEAAAVNGYVELEHTPRTTIPLRAIGMTVPASVRRNYDWCGGKPFEIQIRTVELFTENPRSYCLNSMGTGKTRCVLWAFDYLKKLGLVNKMLVVAPLSTMTFTWGHEILKATPHLRWAVLHGTSEKRLKALADPDIDIYIVNHDGLRIVAAEVVGRTDIDVLTLDELAAFRNSTLRTKIAKKVADAKTIVWGLTGSPMPTAVTDIWNEVRIITPWRVPKYFSHLRDELQYRITQFKWVNKVGAIDKAFEYFQPAVRYTLDDIMELPEAYVPPPIQTGLGVEQKRIYESLKKFAIAQIGAGEISAMNAGVVMSKLLQTSAGWLYDSKRNIFKLDGEARLQALTDIIDAAEGKVIVFVNFLHALHGVYDHLIEHAKKRYGSDATYHMPHMITGDTPLKARTDIFNTFQNTGHRGPLVAYPKCISHGVTLTAADTAVWFGPPLSAEVYDQGNARIRRVGQHRKQLFAHLSSTPIEKQVYNLLTSRLLQQDSFLHLLEDASWD
jgi:SNF2 family DNA or RNA helicase